MKLFLGDHLMFVVKYSCVGERKVLSTRSKKFSTLSEARRFAQQLRARVNVKGLPMITEQEEDENATKNRLGRV